MEENDLKEVETSVVNTETTEKKPKKKTTIPQSQFDLLNTAQNILEKWRATPQITLMWITVNDFEELVNQLGVLVEERTNAASKRPSLTQTLGDLDTAINKAVEQVKIAIYNRFGKDKAKAYFAEFGISKVSNNSFKIPNDRNERLNALPLLAGACANYQIETIDYKKSFFSNIVSQYKDALAQSQASVSVVTTKVGNKNESMQKVKEVMQALVLIIKGNYPKTYQNELRAWGFQKERY
jgi:hypothetical protein